MFDLLIKNGTIINGTGSPSFYGDIGIKDGKIVLFGGSPLATQSAAEKFISMIKDGTISTLDGDFEYKTSYHALIADSLALNVESFVPVWADKFTPAAWMLDYEEKLRLFEKYQNNEQALLKIKALCVKLSEDLENEYTNSVNEVITLVDGLINKM